MEQATSSSFIMDVDEDYEEQSSSSSSSTPPSPPILNPLLTEQQAFACALQRFPTLAPLFHSIVFEFNQQKAGPKPQWDHILAHNFPEPRTGQVEAQLWANGLVATLELVWSSWIGPAEEAAAFDPMLMYRVH